jgi:hypothetical protein
VPCRLLSVKHCQSAPMLSSSTATKHILVCSRRAPDPDHLARNTTVLEQLADLARQAELAASGPLLDWLRVLTQLQLPDQRQQQERQRLLRAVVDMRAQMQVRLVAIRVGMSWPPVRIVLLSGLVFPVQAHCSS